MIPTTQAIIDAIEQRSRTFKARWLKSLNPVEELSCNIMSLTVTTGGGGETPVPGALFSSYVNCTVMNLEENIKGFEYYLQIGVVTGYDDNDEEIIGWLPSNGRYTVIKTGVAGERTEFMAVGAITARCQKAYTPATTGYPKTVRAVLNEIQAVVGKTIEIKSPLVATNYIQKPITGQTCASALSVIASLLGGFVTEDYRGVITIAAYGSGSTYPVDLTRFSTRPVFTEDPFSVTGLYCDVSEAYELDVDVAGGGGYSWDYKFISSTAMTGNVYNGVVAALYSDVYEIGDTIGYSCSWEANAWYYDTDWEYQEPFNSSGVEDISFTYGTAATEEVAVEEDEDTGIKVILRIVYNGAATIYTQTVVTIPSASYNVQFGINTGPAHYYVTRIPAVNYSYGTPNITIQNEYMTQALFTAARARYVGYSFTPATLPLTLGNPRLEPWDILQFTEGATSHNVPCHMLTTTFTGGLWQDVSSLMAGASDDGADPVTGTLSAKIDHIASASQIAQAMATSAQTSANSAAAAATSAQVSAKTADQAAKFASKRAEDADREATRAKERADEAKVSADHAAEYASRALGGLSTVQSVNETLIWITQHGTMTLTTDTALDPIHVYFVQDIDGDYEVGGVKYAIVSEPNVDDIATYYELSIDESLNNYVATHLAVTSEGLWLIPENEDGNKVLVATGQGDAYKEAGTYIIGDDNAILARFTESKAVVGQNVRERLSIKPTAIEGYNSTNTRFLLIDYNGSVWRSPQSVTVSEIRDVLKLGNVVTDSGNTIYAKSCRIEGEFPSYIVIDDVTCELVVDYIDDTTSQARFYYDGLDLSVQYLGGISFTAGASSSFTYDPIQLTATIIDRENRRSYSATISIETVFTYDATANTITMSTDICLTSSVYTGSIGDGLERRFTAEYEAVYYAPAFTLGSEGSSALGDWSVRLGLALNAAYDNQTAIGKYNANSSNNAFEIGRGTSDSARSNAFSVEFDGETRLYVDGNTSSGTDYNIRTALNTLGWASDCLES